MFALLLIGLVLPYESIVISYYYSMRSLGLVNTHLSLILPQIGLSIPFSIFWLRASFKSIPKNLSEAAMIEGAGRWVILIKILLPQMIPALLTLTVLLFMWTWNEFLLALIMIQDNEMRTAPLALSYFAGNKRYGDPAITAAAAIWVALACFNCIHFSSKTFYFWNGYRSHKRIMIKKFNNQDDLAERFSIIHINKNQRKKKICFRLSWRKIAKKNILLSWSVIF